MVYSGFWLHEEGETERRTLETGSGGKGRGGMGPIGGPGRRNSGIARFSPGRYRESVGKGGKAGKGKGKGKKSPELRPREGPPRIR